MGRFMIHIELHKASSEVYNKLHEVMYNIEAFQVIQDIDTKEFFNLPRSQYHYIGLIENKEDILDLVRQTIKYVSQDFKIVVTGNDGSAWVGLDKV
ncbi:hypothetical protein [Chryseobacterium sp. sg2396]|uniref:hypothetical protein n=1 Tax=Chryseobacterium sp. sg2396 TaxID=3276280 RepID=UPI00366FD9C7